MLDEQEKILVTRSMLPDFAEYCATIAPLWKSRWLTNMGSLHNELKDDLRQFLGCEMVSLFSNGHLALELGIQALGLEGEVITTPFTFASTTHAIVRNGLKPVFCDIREGDYNIDAGRIEECITDRTSAILAVHVYGNICETERIERVAARHGIKVIYDAAHAFGVRRAGKTVAGLGEFTMFSFHATKVFHTIEGGAITCGSPALAAKVDKLKNFGITSPETVEVVGSNAKMNEFQAAMGICNLRRFEEERLLRKVVFERYSSRLGGTGLTLPALQAGVEGNYAYYPVRCDKERCGIDRDGLFGALVSAGIYPRKYFFPLISDFECYRGRYDSSLTPTAKRISAEVLTLPMYADLPLDSVDRICELIEAALKGGSAKGA